MVKRYSDQSPTLIKTGGVRPVNMGRIDPNPMMHLTNTIKKVANDAQNRYTKLAKDKAIQQGVKDGREHTVTYNSKGIPEYNLPELGGTYYQNAYQEASRLVYERTIQDELVKKIDKGYEEWASDPTNINDMELLESKLNLGADALINELPEEFKSFAINQKNNRVSSSLKTEFMQKNSRALNALYKDLQNNMLNIIEEISNVDPEDVETIKRLDIEFEKNATAYSKLNQGYSGVTESFINDYNQAKNIRSATRMIFHRNEAGDFINEGQFQDIIKVIKTLEGSVTVKDINNKDLVIDANWVDENFTSEAIRGRLAETINKMNADTMKSSVEINNFLDIASQELEDNMANLIKEGWFNQPINLDGIEAGANKKTQLEKIASIVDKVIEDNNYGGNEKISQKRFELIQRYKNQFNNSYNSALQERVNAQKASLAETNYNEAFNDLLDNSLPILDLRKNIDDYIKLDPNNVDLLSFKLLDDKQINFIRGFLDIDINADTMTIEHLNELEQAIMGTGTSEKKYTINGVEYSQQDVSRLIGPNTKIRQTLVKELYHIRDKFQQTSGNKSDLIVKDIMENTQEAKRIFIHGANKNHYDEAFNRIANLGNINIREIDELITTPEGMSGLIELSTRFLNNYNHFPDAVETYFSLPETDPAKLKNQVSLYNQLINFDNGRYFKKIYQPFLNAASNFTGNSALYSEQILAIAGNPELLHQAKLVAIKDISNNENLDNFKTHILTKTEELNEENPSGARTVVNQFTDSIIAELALHQLAKEKGHSNVDLSEKLEAIIKGITQDLITSKDTVYRDITSNSDPRIGMLTDGNIIRQDLPNEDYSKVTSIIKSAGGNENYTLNHIALMDKLSTLDLAIDIKGVDPFRITAEDPTAITTGDVMTGVWGEGFVKTDFKSNTPITISPSIIATNLAGKVKTEKDLFYITDIDGDQFPMVPGKTYEIDRDGFIILKGQFRTEDANTYETISGGYLKTRSGDKVNVSDLISKIADFKNIANENAIKHLKQKEKENLAKGKSKGEKLATEFKEINKMIGENKSTLATWKNLTPIKVGLNKLKDNRQIQLNSQEVKYINTHRAVAVNNASLVKDGEVTTIRGVVVEKEVEDINNINSQYKTPLELANYSKDGNVTRHYIVPSYILTEINNNKRGYVNVAPFTEDTEGVNAKIEKYVEELGGWDSFPNYATKQQALNAEVKMKNIINEDDNVLNNREIPDLTYTEPKTSGRQVAIDAVNKIFSYTGGDNEANKRFITAILGTESDYGMHKLTYTDRISTGMGQMDKIRYETDPNDATKKIEIVSIFDDLKRRYKANKLHPLFKETVKKLEDGINKDFPNILDGDKVKFENLTYEDLNIPLLSVMVMRLWLTTEGDSTRYNTADTGKVFWKDVYNASGKNIAKDHKRFKKYYNDLEGVFTGAGV